MRKVTLILTAILLLQFSLVVQSDAAERDMIFLSLKKVSELALENNLDIQIVRYDAYMKRNDIYDAVSIFDTILNLEVSYEDDQRQRTSTITGTKSTSTEYDFDLTKKLPTGTTIGVGFEHTRDWSNSPYATTNPAHDSQASISLNQEIGKNFFGLIDRNDVKISRLDIENSDYTSLDKIENYLADAHKSYWNVVRGRMKVRIREEMLDRATSLYKIYTNKVKIGLSESPDLYAAQANMNIRKNQLLTAQNDLNTAENDLLLKLNFIREEVIEIKTDEKLTIVDAYQVRFLASLNIAISKRRDYKAAYNDVESKNIKLVTKKNSLWPEIDLKATFTRNGVASYYKEAMDNITDSDNPKYYFGISISYPLENTKARGQYQTAKLDKAKALILLKKKEREIITEINNAVGDVNTTLEKANNNYIIVQLQESKLNEEEKRFKLGRSDSDTLIRFHDDLLSAKISLADSLYAFYSEIIDLKVKENSLLEEYLENVL